MTWSIVARDPRSNAFGVAITTKFFAVGSLCPHVRSGVGALATQALVNPLFGPRGLDLLACGAPAAEAARTLIAADEGRDHRQLHLIDGAGRIAVHTGAACIDWCGHFVGEGFSVAGNMLAGPAVIADTAASYAADPGRPFAERLIRALEAGQAAGGDKRGKQSAALLIHAGEDYPELDLRVDDHPEPLAELRRLWVEAHKRFLPFKTCLPSRARPAGIYDRAKIEATIEAELARAAAGGADTA
ncbi:MAG: DUF1028 domain-containing protein [Rhodospirillales bacterium]|nr:DUF1028 domain-containing protein [Rhodospirillales bacterium]